MGRAAAGRSKEGGDRSGSDDSELVDTGPERVYLVGVQVKSRRKKYGYSIQESLEELGRLAETAGLEARPPPPPPSPPSPPAALPRAACAVRQLAAVDMMPVKSDVDAVLFTSPLSYDMVILRWLRPADPDDYDKPHISSRAIAYLQRPLPQRSNTAGAATGWHVKLPSCANGESAAELVCNHSVLSGQGDRSTSTVRVVQVVGGDVMIPGSTWKLRTDECKAALCVVLRALWCVLKQRSPNHICMREILTHAPPARIGAAKK